MTMRVVGFGMLFGYLWHSGDWRLSLPWALAFPAVSLVVGWTFVSLRFSERFLRLNTYLLYPANERVTESPLSEDEWALRQAKYVESGMRGGLILTAPAEDGFICVPVLLTAISPISVLVGGIVFGCMHLARFTYLECSSVYLPRMHREGHCLRARMLRCAAAWIAHRNSRASAHGCLGLGSTQGCSTQTIAQGIFLVKHNPPLPRCALTRRCRGAAKAAP